MPHPVYLFFRLLMSGYSLAALLHTLINLWDAADILKYFTIWSYALLTAHLFLCLVLSALFYR